MFSRGLFVLKTGFSVVLNAMGLLALMVAAWLMPYMLELVVQVVGIS